MKLEGCGHDCVTYRSTPGRNFKIVDDYEITIDGNKIIIPAGTETNGISVPRIIWSIINPFRPDTLPAVVIHDYLCKIAISYEDFIIADDVYGEALRSLEISEWLTSIMVWFCKAYHTIRYKWLRSIWDTIKGWFN